MNGESEGIRLRVDASSESHPGCFRDLICPGFVESEFFILIRRVGFHYYGGSGSVLNDNSVALFDAAVAWATGSAPKVSYQRDATDRITQRSVNGRTVARYSYTGSGDSSDLTLDGANNVVEATLVLPGGALFSWRSAAPVWSYSNTHGDVVITTDNTGTKQGPTRAYDPFGQSLTTAAELDNSVGEFDYGWLGEHQRPLEHQTGAIQVIEMGARQYDPMLGRFIEVDPIEGGTPNDYLYPPDPNNQLDLDGNKTCGVRDKRMWKVKRGGRTYYMRCSNRFWGYNHIRARRHFNGYARYGEVSGMIKSTIRYGRSRIEGSKRVFEYKFVCAAISRTPNGSPPRATLRFTVRVVAWRSNGNIVTAYILNRALDRSWGGCG